ncbi:MAG: ATP-binding cassette domain-containing protein [Oscillospiraceae bacterium]|jgi:lincosamide and streptogramin A transport system ATP-binding/permease protein|nr:ATP-binding cassette domain-containing protein [Oscillospiraceae bacterium]
MSTISIKNLTFSYDGGDDLFHDLSLDIDTSWRLGFVGRNGRGKTTFFKLLCGELRFTGKIISAVTFERFPFDVESKSANTADIIQRISNAEDWRIERELNLLAANLGVLDRPLDTLSGGEQTKVLLAALFLKENNFLLLDEPTNHLDAFAKEQISEYLRGKSGYILISHDRDFLDRATDHTLALNKTGIELQSGNFSAWFTNKQMRDEFEQNENAKLKKDIKRLSAAAKRTAEWSDQVEKSKHIKPSSGNSIDSGYVGHKSAKMMKRAKSLEQRQTAAAEQKSTLLKDVERADDLIIRPLASPQKVLLRLGSLEVNGGDRVLIEGANGSGKTTLIKQVIAEHTNLVISYVPQHTDGMSGSLKDFARHSSVDLTLFLTNLRQLDFPRELLQNDIATFSEGQKKKVLLAKSLSENAHLYVWDEPLNFIDIFSRQQLADVIVKFTPTMLLIEHDRAFGEQAANKKYLVEKP